MKKLFLVLLIVLLFLISSCGGPKYTKESLDKFANCLADNNVKEYGAFWCSKCAKQEKMFGSSYKIIKERGVYVECDPRGDNPRTELCLEKGIDKYPIWEFADGEMLEPKIQDFETLAAKAGCEAPKLTE